MWLWQNYSMLIQWLACIHCKYCDIRYPRYVCICVLECILCQYYILRPMQSARVVVLFYISYSHELNTKPVATERGQKQAGIYIYTNMLTQKASNQSLCRDWTWLPSKNRISQCSWIPISTVLCIHVVNNAYKHGLINTLLALHILSWLGWTA